MAMALFRQNITAVLKSPVTEDPLLLYNSLITQIFRVVCNSLDLNTTVEPTLGSS